ncbi:MAG: fatty acid--CoA ligase [Motiliproteus sp.]
MKTKIIEPTPSAYSYPLLIKRVLMSGVEAAPDQEIVYRGQFRYSYREFQARVCRLANLLTNVGVKAGDTVAVLDWDSHRYLECFFAIPMIGAVLHTVNIRLAPEQILYTMNHARDDFVLVHEDFVPIIEGLGERLSTVSGFITIEESAASASSGNQLETLGSYESLMEESSDRFDFPDFDENSVATTFYTTGTTGNPKGVYFTHRQLVLHTLATMATVGAFEGGACLRSDDVYMPITPMFHVHAWGVPYVATMLGVKQVYPGRYEPNKLVDLIESEQVTFSHCVPTILQMLLNCDRAAEIDWSRWTVLIGGGAFPRGLAEQAIGMGAGILSAYGMSETCPILTTTRLSKDLRELSDDERLGYILKTGVAAPMVELKVVNSAGEEVAKDNEEVGEIIVRAPWLTQGYLYESERSEELWEHGWLLTGDVASVDERGFVQVRDRIKDVIKSGGEWISSLLLESFLSRHPAVSEVAVVGVPDPRWEERPHGLIVTLDDGLTAEQLMNHMQQFVDTGEISSWAVPRSYDFVSSIPKTSVGKLDKKLIRSTLVDANL